MWGLLPAEHPQKIFSRRRPDQMPFAWLLSYRRSLLPAPNSLWMTGLVILFLRAFPFPSTLPDREQVGESIQMSACVLLLVRYLTPSLVAMTLPKPERAIYHFPATMASGSHPRNLSYNWKTSNISLLLKTMFS